MSSSPPSVESPEQVDLPVFITRFGLDGSADERAVKRAYARELKQIDQELDPAAFQDLREARDAALYWLQVQQYERIQEALELAGEEGAAPAGDAALEPADPAAVPDAPPLRDAQAVPPPQDPAAGSAEPVPEPAPEPVPEPLYQHRHPELIYPDDPAPAEAVAPPTAASEPEKPEAIGEVVFNEFADELGVTSQFGQRVLSAPQLRQQLERFLDDPRLLQIDAKDVFEWLIARMLAQGWKPGHETLMEVAAARFDWTRDRRRLYRFGQAGQVLDRYMQELIAFEQEDEPTRDILRDTLRNLRLRAEPPPDEPESMRRAEYLAARFPHLLGLLANGENFENWRKLTAAVQERQERAAAHLQKSVDARGSAAPKSEGSYKAGAICFAVIVALMLLVRFIVPSLPDAREMQQDAAASRRALSDKAIAEVLKSTVGPANCKDVADYARERGIGTAYPHADPTVEFDRYVLSCVTGGNWPGKLDNDVVVPTSIARLSEKPEYANLVKGAQARVKVDTILAGAKARSAASFVRPAQPLSDAALDTLTRSTIDYPNCATAADYAQERGIGTTYPRATPGPEFDRFVLMCVTGDNWPNKLENDIVVASSIARLRGKPEYANLVKGAAARVKSAELLARNEALAAKAAKAKADKAEAAPADPHSPWGKSELERAQGDAKKRTDFQKEGERIIKEMNAKLQIAPVEPRAPALVPAQPAQPASVTIPPSVVRGEPWYKGEIDRQNGVAPKPVDKRYEWEKSDYGRVKQDLDPLKLGEPQYGGSARRPSEP